MPDQGLSEGSGHRPAVQEALVAWASTQPSATTDPDLGDPILPSIKVDGSPLAAAIDAIQLDDNSSFWDCQKKGNLLLVADRAKEAHEVFLQGLDVAQPKQQANAIEDIARAIRAENGCVGPANAYILRTQQETP